jgi:hypothetical protein
MFKNLSYFLEVVLESLEGDFFESIWFEDEVPKKKFNATDDKWDHVPKFDKKKFDKTYQGRVKTEPGFAATSHALRTSQMTRHTAHGTRSKKVKRATTPNYDVGRIHHIAANAHAAAAAKHTELGNPRRAKRHQAASDVHKTRATFHGYKPKTA